MSAEYKYAGFWRRVVAYFIDAFVVNLILIPIIIALLIIADTVGDTLRGAIFSIIIFTMLFGFTIIFSLFERSSWQATPGKRLLSLKVVGLDGNRITFWRAFGRNIGKILSSLLFYIGFLMIGWTRKKQGLHDMMAGGLVIRTMD